MDAQRLIALVDAVDAVAGADAGADQVLLPGDDLADDVGVGDQRPGHADHVELALRDGVAGRRHVVDAGGVEDGDACRGADLAGEVKVGGGAHPGDGDDVDQGGVGVHVAADDVEEVEAGGLEAAGDLDAFLAGKAGLPVLVGDHAQAEQEAGADGVAHGLHDPERERHAVVQAAAKGVVPLVGGRRPELVGQVAVGVDLQPVEAGGLHTLGGGGVVGHDAVDVPGLDLLGKGPVGRLADRRGGEDREPVGLVPGGAAAEVGDLDHHGGAEFMALVGKAAHPGDDLVLVGEQVAEHGRAVGGDDGGAGGHGQRHAAAGLLGVVKAVAVLGHAVLAVVRLVRGGHHAVAQRQVLELERLEQRGPPYGRRRGRLRSWTNLKVTAGAARCSTVYMRLQGRSRGQL